MCLLGLQALLYVVELIAQGLKAICHTDLGHIGLTDVIALWTLLQVVITQVVSLFLEHRKKVCFVMRSEQNEQKTLKLGLKHGWMERIKRSH